MKIIRYNDLKSVPWLNGAGLTRQVAASAGPASDWRISIARVGLAGPFSVMPGMDRVITLVAGELIVLAVDEVDHLLERHLPYRFSGDCATSASLPTGGVTALNVVTRRGKFSGSVAIVELSDEQPHPVFAGQYAMLSNGSAVVTEADRGPNQQPSRLAPFDVVVGSLAVPRVIGRGFLAVASVEPVV